MARDGGGFVADRSRTPFGIEMYEKGDRTPHPDPEVARIIKEKAAELGSRREALATTTATRRYRPSLLPGSTSR
jgi:3-hydroxyacyl-CoA dehydrogenase